jgi:hypothetical protein
MATDEFRFHSPDAKAGILFIRALEDEDVLAAAREQDPWQPTSLGFQVISDRLGPDTNPLWITGQAAEAAYMRGLIDETEFDYLTR